MQHQDNTPTHTAQNIHQFLTKRNTPIFAQTGPLFPKIKSVLKGTHFSDIDSIKIAVMIELKKLPENAFQECIESWKT